MFSLYLLVFVVFFLLGVFFWFAVFVDDFITFLFMIVIVGLLLKMVAVAVVVVAAVAAVVCCDRGSRHRQLARPLRCVWRSERAGPSYPTLRDLHFFSYTPLSASCLSHAETVLHRSE